MCCNRIFLTDLFRSSLKLFRKSWHPRSRGEMKQLSPSQELVSYLRFARMQVTLEWLLIKLNHPVADIYSGSLTLVSNYLETISNLLLYLIEEDKETDPIANSKFLGQINLVEQISVQFLMFYPQLGAYQRKYGHQCFLKIINSLYTKHNQTCIPFIDRTLPVVLSQVIASPTAAELEILTDAWKAINETHSKREAKRPLELKGVSSYLGIWVNMVNAKMEPIPAKLIYDGIISWSLLTIDKLDLTMILGADDDQNSVVGQEEQHPSDIYSSMTAVKPKDFQLLINLIEFLQKFLNSASDETMFSNWVEEFVIKVTDHAIKNPFVSAFYKILATALQVSDKLNYFDPNSFTAGRIKVQEKCSEFMKSILIKMDTFRDDLLISVLELWLSIPDIILVQNEESWCLTLQKIFQTGRLHLPLADKSADALQRWMTLDSIPREIIEDIVVKLFPLWRTYFLAEGSHHLQMPNKSLDSTKFSKKQDEVELIRSTTQDDEILKRVQVKLLKVIGSFAHVIDLGSDHSTDICLEQNYSILKLKIPLGQTTFDIYLDFICPRVIKLSEESANRQVRTTACEFLHTLFLYFLGDSVRSNNTGQQAIHLFVTLFTTIMKLSGDSDFLIRQLFNPLATQSVHWFTKQKNAYSDSILQIIVDGLVSDDSRLKDFSSDCLYEFFKWALKHDTKLLVKDVIQYIMALSSHANVKYRLGSCVAFNSIYRDFREDFELVNCYSIVLMNGFLASLSVLQPNETDSIIAKSTKQSISHLERIITKKKDNFNNKIGDRKNPPWFRGDKIQFRDLADWLVLQLGKPENVYREECGRLLKVIAPIVRGCGSVEAYLVSCAFDEPTIIRTSERCKISIDVEDMNMEELLTFLDSAADCYTFFYDHNCLNFTVFQHPNSRFVTAAMVMFSKFQYCEKVQLETLARISVRLQKLEPALTDFQRNEFQKFLIKISKIMISEENVSSILQILVHSKSTWSQEVRVELKREFSRDKIQQDLLQTKNFLQLQWLRLAIDNNLMDLDASTSSDTQVLLDLFWNNLKRKLFGPSEDDSSLKSSDILELNSDELEELLKICIELGIGCETVLDTALDTQLFRGISKRNVPDILSTRGEFFLKHLVCGMFHPTLIDFVHMSMRVKIEKIGSYIEFLLGAIQGSKSLRQKAGNLLFESIIKIWTQISVNCDKYTVLRILSGLVWLDLKGSRDSIELSHWWCGKDAMGAANIDFSEQGEIIGFMGLFGQSSDSRIVESVINTTKKLIHHNFPASANHQEFISALVKQILGLFQRDPKNLKILELLLATMFKMSTFPDELNFLYKAIAQRLMKLSQAYASDKDAVDTSSFILETIMSAKEYENNRNVFLYCLRPTLVGMRNSAFRLFFKGKIKLLMDTLLDSTKPASSVFHLNVDRIVYNLLSMIPKRNGARLLLAELTAEYQQCQTRAGIPESERKSILKVISSAFLQIKQRKMPITNVYEMQCHSSAYHTLSVILVVSENLPNHRLLMEGLLIHEDKSKRKYLWETFIDCSKDIQDYFPVLFEPTNKAQSNVENIAASSGSTAAENIILSATAAATQSAKARINLASSSLYGENSANNFDFTCSTPLEEASFYHDVLDPNEGEANGFSATKSHTVPVVTIKCAAFADESIEGLVSTIKKLTSLSSEDEQPWMKYLLSVLNGRDHHENIKIFILVALLNCQKEILPYAKIFINPICKVLMSTNWKDPLNYFVKDVLVMLLDWHEVAIPSSSAVVSEHATNLRKEMCEFIVANIVQQDQAYSRNDLLEINLHLLDAVVRLWKIETSELNSCPGFNFVDSQTPKVGILLCKCALRNNVLPREDPLTLLRQFCSLLEYSSKPIYSDAAESLGLILRLLKNGNYQDIDKVSDHVVRKLRKEQSRRPPAFLLILEQIQKNFPQIAGVFHKELLEMLGKKSFDSSGIDIIQILFSSLLVQLENPAENPTAAVRSFIFNLNGRNVFNATCTSPAETILGVRIFEEVFVKFPNAHPIEMFLKMVTWLSILQQDTENTSLQSRYYICISKIYFQPSTLDAANKDLILKVFIDALKHESSEVRNTIEEFWMAVLDDCKNPQDLLVRLLELYGQKQNSLEIILGRILQRCSVAPDFQKTIFDKPLEDCVFHEFNLDRSWRTKQASFLPLFAESISSQPLSTIPQALQASVMRQGHHGVNLLRASLSLCQQQFTQTLGVDSSNKTNMATWSNPLSKSITSLEDEEQTQKQANAHTEKTDNELSQLRKRFYVRPAESAAFFAARQVGQREMKMNVTLDKLKSKQSMKVTRSYRIGEIPDIMIKYADMLTTLIKLGQCDSECARLIVGQIFSNVFNSIMEENNKVHHIFNTILETPKISATLVATIMDISIRNKILVSSNCLANICTQNDLYELGIIMLENHLSIKMFEDLPSSSKRRRVETPGSLEAVNESALLNIACLYYELQEVDVLKNIFVQLSGKSKSNSFYKTLCALNTESIGKVDIAAEQYLELLDDLKKNFGVQDQYVNLIESSYIKCLSQLSEWDKLMDVVGQSIFSPEQNGLHNKYTEKKLLTRAGLMLTLEEQTHANLSNVTEFVQQLEKLDGPPINVEQALLLLGADLNNANRATVLLEQFWQAGITTFTNFSHLSLPQKNEQILQYQLASTLSDMMLWQKDLCEENVVEKTVRLVSKFKKLNGSNISPLFNSGIVTKTRSCFVKKLLYHELLVDDYQCSEKLSLLNFHQHLWMLSLSTRDQLCTVSNKYLDSSRQLGSNVSADDFLEWRKSYAAYLDCFCQSLPLKEWMPMWGSAYKKIRIDSSTCEKINPTSIIEMHSHLLKSLVACTRENKIANASFPIINKSMGIKSNSTIIKVVQTGTKIVFDLVKHPENKENMSPEASLQLYYLMEELLRSFPDTYPSNDDSLTILLESLLRSMSTENDDVTLRFPRLLDLIQKNFQLRTTFSTLWNIIPTWKFLPWLDQIMTTYNGDPEMNQLFLPIVQKIAKKYPDALMLQYNNCIPGYQDHHVDYVKSLKALVFPTILHKAALDEILLKIKEKDVSVLRDSILNFQQVIQDILSQENIYGSIHINFAREIWGHLSQYLTEIGDDFPMAGDDKTEKSLASLKTGIEEARKHEKRIFPDQSGSMKIKQLNEFSPWLASFHHIQMEEVIKFPGLHDKLSKPDVNSHPSIVSFNPTVQIYRSLTFPIRMSVLGNDGKRQSFLTKYGDDLRQDRRIQQLLRVANNFFSNNSQTRERKINIVTYSVIPLTESFGIIEWLDKTLKVSSFILNTKQLEGQMNTAAMSHQGWLEKTSGLKPPAPLHHIYAGAAKNASRQNAEFHFDSLVSTTPNSLFSEHLMERCKSYEQFFKVRQNCIRSYAAMCLVHWLLGIGDRHLQNALLSLETGKVIGIDFGRAFETTNTDQPIPEMIPFRCSPNFQNLMMPYGYKGLFRETMCIVWRCLLQGSDTILFIINTLVNEHNIKWTGVRKEKLPFESVLEKQLVEWLPMQTIKRKLLCENPTNILLKTLENNPWKDITPVYCDIVKNSRADDEGVFTHEQVIDCLLDLATDKNILARLYVGLLSWI
ncbi:DNA-dependent protein kinase catalytic subunit isoform X3 [Folsomia candida]|uniref:DNA-dependent protein kinase catalytic subunit isoform X3 n=1 Tax=Folsomia candida TaxID=158441 RepID=UPI0016051419|nr:DNA-dependent protein kinase catalytic subunit isoform X3 [Folsomia candida]